MEQTGQRARRLDLLFYLVSLLFAAASAMFSEFYGYRVWGNFATVGYLLAAVLTGLTHCPVRVRHSPRTCSGPAGHRSRWPGCSPGSSRCSC